MNTSLATEPRAGTGKSSARKVRKAGKIPAVVYSNGGEATPVTVDPKALTKIFRTTRNRNTVVELDVEGTTVPAIVKEAQRHPVSRDLLHVDFLAVSGDKPVTVMVPVRPQGKPKGAALGGRLRVIRRTLRTRATYDKIPEAFDIDVSEMSIGDMLKASQIPTPDGVEVVFDHDFNVLIIAGKRGGGTAAPAAE